jgi:hypothetical protein
MNFRGKYYGIAAAFGKLGAFIGTYSQPAIMNSAGPKLKPNIHQVARGQRPFWVASSIGLAAGLIALFFLPDITQESIEQEDVNFREYLHSHGYDTSMMGVQGSSTEQILETGEQREKAL